MALNLIKTGGKPTSYAPLSGMNQSIPLGIGSYVLTFIGSSASSTQVQIFTDDAPRTLDTNAWTTPGVVLSPDSRPYTISFTMKNNANLYIYDRNSRGDIYLSNISLVQQPLPDLTVNGVDGFLSGKWIIPSQFTVNNDSSITLVAPDTGNYIAKLQGIPVIAGQKYTVGGIFDSVHSRIRIGKGSDDSLIGDTSTVNPWTFTVPSGETSINLRIDNNSTGGWSAGTFTFSNIVLNPGPNPAPYSKKTGTKMVLPIPGKNLLKGMSSSDNTTASGNGTYTVNSEYSLTVAGTNWNAGFNAKTAFLTVGKSYSLSCMSTGSVTIDVYNPDSSLLVTSQPLIAGSGNGVYTFTTTQSGIHTIRFKNTSQIETYTMTNWQLEPGTVATPFVPYAAKPNKTPGRTNANGQPAILKSNKGLSFNPNGGITDYVTAPFQSYVSGLGNFQIDGSFLINALPPGSNGYCLVQNSNSANDRIAVFVNPSGQLGISYYNGTAWVGASTTGTCPVNQVVNFTAIGNNGVLSLFVNGVQQSGTGTGYAGTVSSYMYIGLPTSNQSTNAFMGVMRSLKVTNLATGQVGFSYDFTNPKNIVGNTVFLNAQNLLPAFTDPGWTINANAKVMGKDSLHLDATGTYQNSYYTAFSASPNQNYLLGVGSNATARITVGYFDSNMSLISFGPQAINGFITFTTPSNCYNIKIYLDNGNTTSGSYNFSKPQLFQLSGNEGTINGNPVQLNKPSKRTLFAKR